jgi:hypothetical protein
MKIMPTKKTASQLSEIAIKAVRVRRRKHPGGSKERLSADAVAKEFEGRKQFSTGDIMRTFGAAKDNATAVVAVLRQRSRIEKFGEAPDKTSLWRWV